MHPSLESEFIPPPPLTPKLKMGRNEPCWCGSGKKWKKCHKDRHLQEEIPIGKLVNDINQQNQKGVCLHPNSSKENCSKGVIKAHTVQRSGGLKAIAENGHVISPKKGYENIFRNEGEIKPDKIGVGNASTFMGFCSTHDNSLFEPIEKKDFHLNHEAAFLLAFRALAYEYLTKLNSVKMVELQRELDRGKDFYTQVAIQQHLHLFLAGSRRGIKDLEEWKGVYDKKFRASDFDSMPHYAIEFNGVLPLVCSGGFYPEVDFNGNQLQLISRGNSSFEHVFFNISAIGSKSFLVFAWVGSKDGPAEHFVRSFMSLRKKEKANAALILAVEQLENTYFKPSWWNGLSYIHKQHLINRMRSGTQSAPMRNKDTYSNLMPILGEIEITSELSDI